MSKVAKYRKKPVVIEAIQVSIDNYDDVRSFCPKVQARVVGVTGHRWNYAIPTLEGTMTAIDGDWIIKGVKGEFYPCKPDVFAATYEPV